MEMVVSEKSYDLKTSHPASSDAKMNGFLSIVKFI